MSPAPVSVLSNHLRDLRHAPIPDWRNLWSNIFWPTVNFGCNVEDISTENDVLASVGSYGSQINRLLDAVAVLVDLAVSEEAVLTHEQTLALLQVKKLAAEARQATERSEARQSSGPLRPSVP
jgi:hypothetical protein